jgi:hypothetical protein
MSYEVGFLPRPFSPNFFLDNRLNSTLIPWLIKQQYVLLLLGSENCYRPVLSQFTCEVISLLIGHSRQNIVFMQRILILYILKKLPEGRKCPSRALSWKNDTGDTKHSVQESDVHYEPTYQHGSRILQPSSGWI